MYIADSVAMRRHLTWRHPHFSARCRGTGCWKVTPLTLTRLLLTQIGLTRFLGVGWDFKKLWPSYKKLTQHSLNTQCQLALVLTHWLKLLCLNCLAGSSDLFSSSMSIIESYPRQNSAQAKHGMWQLSWPNVFWMMLELRNTGFKMPFMLATPDRPVSRLSGPY